VGSDLLPSGGKLAAMTVNQERTLITAGLQINETSGEVSSQTQAKAQPWRLSPVNKRVLLTLLQQPGRITTRQQLFDRVWPQQSISDDTLSRAIADLRAQLKPLANTEPLIETIPKTGYRWVPEIQLSDSGTKNPNMAPTLWQRLQYVAIGLVLTLLLPWGLMGWVIQSLQTVVNPLVILPTANAQANEPADVATLLMSATQQHDDLQYLSQYAWSAHQGNPFPYFNHEFGVRWFIEHEWRLQAEPPILTLNLIDAKTALVIHSTSEIFVDEASTADFCAQFMQFIATL